MITIRSLRRHFRSALNAIAHALGKITGARNLEELERGGSEVYEADVWDLDHIDPLAAADAFGGRYVRDITALKSRESRNPTQITFTNTLDETIRIFWINYSGEEVRYKTLAPEQSHIQQTFFTHPWTFTTLKEPRRRLVVQNKPVFYAIPGEPQPIVVRVERPEICAWTPEQHHDLMPPRFKAAVAALLLCHHRLEGELLEAWGCAGEADCDEGEEPGAGPAARGGAPAEAPAEAPADDVEIEIDASVPPWSVGPRALEIHGNAAMSAGPGDESIVTVRRAPPPSTLAVLPLHLVLDIAGRCAPRVPRFEPVDLDAMTLGDNTDEDPPGGG